MKRFICIAACVALAAFATPVLAAQNELLKDVQGCTRHYDGSVAAGVLNPVNLTGTLKIDCDPLEITKANAAAIKAKSDAEIAAIKAKSDAEIAAIKAKAGDPLN